MKKKKLPKFESEQAEQKFWATHDSTEYVDWEKAQRVTFPNLAPSIKNISIRLPASMLEKLKVLAHKKDVPYQSLMKIYLAERIKRELAA